LRIRFVDRRVELEALAAWASRQRELPLYLYGPEGCGKTRLVKEFVARVEELVGGDTLAVYIDALEESSLRSAIAVSAGLSPALDALEDLVAGLGEGVGRVLAKQLTRLLGRILSRTAMSGKKLVVVVDDVVGALGLERVEWYIKWVYEASWRLLEEYGLEAATFIVLTSEGRSLEKVWSHSHAATFMVWNLGRQAFEELVEQLSVPEGLDREAVWRLLGGNPRRLLELVTVYDWSLEAMLDAYTERLRGVVEYAAQEGLTGALARIVEDPDAAAEAYRAKRLLLEHNLLLPVSTMLGFHRLEPSRSLGVGRHYAWQTPLLREAVAKLLGEPPG